VPFHDLFENRVPHFAGLHGPSTSHTGFDEIIAASLPAGIQDVRESKILSIFSASFDKAHHEERRRTRYPSSLDILLREINGSMSCQQNSFFLLQNSDGTI
jgi:hypothetical protein